MPFRFFSLVAIVLVSQIISQVFAQVDAGLAATHPNDRAARSTAPQAYVIYDANGRPVRYNALLAACKNADVVFFGEQHNNPISHWLTYELFKALLPQSDKARSLMLAMEMLEVHQQELVDAYMNRAFDYDSLANTTNLWPNFKTDYRPVLDLAREQKEAKVLASNITRSHASRVFKAGIEAVQETGGKNLNEKDYPPLDFEIPYDSRSYQEMIEMMGGHSTHGHGSHGHGANGDLAKRFVQAQAIKDATMAWRILRHLSEETRIFHVNGAFHTQYKEGIVWYLNYFAERNKRFEKPSVVTISQENVDEPGKFDQALKGKADFIILVPNSMTKTY